MHYLHFCLYSTRTCNVRTHAHALSRSHTHTHTHTHAHAHAYTHAHNTPIHTQNNFMRTAPKTLYTHTHTHTHTHTRTHAHTHTQTAHHNGHGPGLCQYLIFFHPTGPLLTCSYVAMSKTPLKKSNRDVKSAQKRRTLLTCGRVRDTTQWRRMRMQRRQSGQRKCVPKQYAYNLMLCRHRHVIAKGRTSQKRSSTLF
jgi:hypothetical protein